MQSARYCNVVGFQNKKYSATCILKKTNFGSGKLSVIIPVTYSMGIWEW